jgi:hypothetical protein
MEEARKQLRALGDQLSAQLPDIIPLGLEVESSDVQAALEQYIDTVLRERFAKLESELASQIANLEGSADSGIAAVHTFQKQETAQISEYLGKIRDQQNYQQTLVEDIQLTIRERKEKSRNEGERLREDIESLRKEVEILQRDVQKVEYSTQQKRIKVGINAAKVHPEHLEIQVESHKDYTIEKLFAQFVCADGLPLGEPEQCWTSDTYSLAANSAATFYSRLCPGGFSAVYLCDQYSTIVSPTFPLA